MLYALDQRRGKHFKSCGELHQFRNSQPALPAFHLCYERLRALQFCSELALCEVGVTSRGDEDGAYGATKSVFERRVR
jgi:hypothetical protein